MIKCGRQPIFTDVEYIDERNIIPVLRDAVRDFASVANDCTYLLKFEKGFQPLQRKNPKTFRPDIDFCITDNVASEIVNFKTSYNWGNPITFVQRGEQDSGKKKETDAISLLNECYEAEGIRSKTQGLARFVEICGIGHTLVEINKDYEDGDSYFSVNVLDPRYSFVVHSSRYVDHRPMLGVSFREKDGNKYYTCFTKRQRFEIINAVKIVNGKPKISKGEPVTYWDFDERSGEANLLGRIPITEWIRSHDRMGCFERCLDELNGLNLQVSDYHNQVDQATQCVWHTNDVDFPEDESGNVVKPESGDWMRTYTSPDGKTPIVEPLKLDGDYTGMLSQMSYRVARIKSKCNVPLTSENVSNTTGIAVSDATGWTNAEIAATMQDQITESCKMEEVKSVLAAINASTDVPTSSPLLDLKYKDLQPSIKRQKNYELTTKANFAVTLIKAGFHGGDVIKEMNVFPDPNQVWIDSKKGIEAFQKAQYASKSETSTESNKSETEKVNTDRIGQDNSDQISNSPRLDGMKTEQKKIEANT